MSVDQQATQTGAVSMTGQAAMSTGYVKMILQGGPLDGEQSLVQCLPTTPGSIMTFNVPNWQTFAPDGYTLIGYGLQVQYSLIGQGPPPVPANGDTWDSSWIFGFVPSSYIAPPAPITPPITPPSLSPAVWMSADTGLIVNADDPSPGVWMLDTQSSLYVEADVTATGWASVSMEADTTLIGFPVDWSTYSVALTGETSMMVGGTALSPVPGYIARWNAQSITGVGEGVGVSIWGDLSGNSWNLTPNGAPKYYALSAAYLINNKPAVTFNGTTDTFFTTNPVLTQASPWTVFSVTQVATGGPLADYAFESGTNTGFTGLITDPGGNMLSLLFGNVAWNQFPALTTPTRGKAHCEIASWAGPGNPINALLDGTLATVTPSQTPQATVGHTWVGGDGYGPPSRYHNGQIGEVIVWNRALSTDEMQQMWLYAQQMWNFPIGSGN